MGAEPTQGDPLHPLTMENSTHSARPLRIFILEDHPATLKYYRIYLGGEGHTVLHAMSIGEAIEAIPQANCDVLISDMGLPDGDGWTLLNRLREEGLPHPRFAVAVSGYGTTSDRLRSVEAGFRHHLLKPFDLSELDEILEEAAREVSRIEATET